VPVWVAKCLQA